MSTRATARQWRNEREQRRRDERRAAYEALLLSVQVTAHRLGNLGDEDYGPPAVDRQGAAYFFDTEVTPKVRSIQLIVPAGSEVVEAALDLRAKLAAFRDGMARTDEPPQYRSSAYTAIYDPVVKARDRFIEIAGRDLDK
jgi:hypothetical protein